MQNSMHLLRTRRFLPLFVTQFLGAFNDNLFKTAMVLFVTFQVYSDPNVEMQFNALATGLFILPFFLLSALAGQLADTRDKAAIIRIVKTAEIFIMAIGAVGLMLPSIPLMLAAVLAMGVHSTFFGPIKYAVLPQHLEKNEVLGGTGLVEAGTYIAILAGTITAGFITEKPQVAAALVLIVAFLGWLAGRQVPAAPPVHLERGIDWHILRASRKLVSDTMHIKRLFLAICSISFFWTIGSVLVIQFPPLVKNTLTSDEQVASLFLAIFSIGVAVGSVIVNRLLKNEVSARYSPISVMAMAVFVLGLYFIAKTWEGDAPGQLYDIAEFVRHPSAVALLVVLFGVAITGGMFVVPLYAFLTTTVDKDQTARTVAANNIVNSGSMVAGAMAAFALSALGVSTTEQLLLVCAMCFVSAWIARQLQRACETGDCP